MPPQIETALLRLFADCPAALIIGHSYSVEAGGRILRLTIDPIIDNPPHPEGECESNVYDAVRLLVNEHGRRVTTKEVFAELETVGQIWGRSTVVNALASLVHKGLLVNPRDKKGYGIPTMPDHDRPPSTLNDFIEMYGTSS